MSRQTTKDPNHICKCYQIIGKKSVGTLKVKLAYRWFHCILAVPPCCSSLKPLIPDRLWRLLFLHRRTELAALECAEDRGQYLPHRAPAKLPIHYPLGLSGPTDCLHRSVNIRTNRPDAIDCNGGSTGQSFVQHNWKGLWVSQRLVLWEYFK